MFGQIIKWVVGMDDLPPQEEADRAVREAEMPWMSVRARAEFAKHPEVQGRNA
jgi:hypothetical protein